MVSTKEKPLNKVRNRKEKYLFFSRMSVFKLSDMESQVLCDLPQLPALPSQTLCFVIGLLAGRTSSSPTDLCPGPSAWASFLFLHYLCLNNPCSSFSSRWDVTFQEASCDPTLNGHPCAHVRQRSSLGLGLPAHTTLSTLLCPQTVHHLKKELCLLLVASTHHKPCLYPYRRHNHFLWVITNFGVITNFCNC